MTKAIDNPRTAYGRQPGAAMPKHAICAFGDERGHECPEKPTHEKLGYFTTGASLFACDRHAARQKEIGAIGPFVAIDAEAAPGPERDGAAIETELDRRSQADGRGL